MNQDIKQDPAHLCPENLENKDVNLETHVKRRGDPDLGLSLQVKTGKSTEAIHNPEGESDTIKIGRSKEKKPPFCVRSFNLET